MGDRAQASVLLKAVDSPWAQVGAGESPGITVEGLSLSANDFGPDALSMRLRRRAALPWPDLAAFNQAEAWIGGVPLWGGRLWEAPLSDGGEDQIAVAGRGWQYHLDDDYLDKFYVHTDLSAWRDTRTFNPVTLGVNDYGVAGSVGGESGVVQLGFTGGETLGASARLGIMLDLGPNRTAKRIVITYGSSANAATIELYVRGHNTSDLKADEGGGLFNTAIGPTSLNTLGASGTVAGTLTTARRYVSIFLFHNSGAGVTVAAGTEHYLQIRSIQVFAATAYESGNASILKADQVIKDVLAGAPLLSSDVSQIAAGSFSIPALAPDGYQTPRQLMTAANAYEGRQLAVDYQRRVVWRTRPTVPLVETGSWSGAEFQDASTSSADLLYNQVVVQGTAPDRAPLSVTRTLPSSLLTAQGFNRTALLPISAPLTTAAANALGDIWLADKAKPPMKGTLKLTSMGGGRLISGVPLHPSELLLRVGEPIRIGHLIDPVTGAVGRDGTIRSVSYDHDSETATLEIDSERGRVETFLNRLGALTAAALAGIR